MIQPWHDMRQLIMPRQEGFVSHMNRVGSAPPASSNRVTWVQTERATHEAWGMLTVSSPRAAALAHFLVANMEQSGAVVASYATLSKMSGMSVSTIRRAVDDLKAGRWIEVVQIGGKGGANAFIINARVAWSQGRDRMHLAAFSARVIADREEQTFIDDAPLRRIPTIMPGERQLPSGPGEEPPAQPSIEGLEPDLPAIQGDAAERAELESRGQLRLTE